MFKKYLNLTRKKMNLQIERYKVIPVKIGIGRYPIDIAEKFPMIFKLVDETKVEEVVVDETKVEEVVVDETKVEEVVVDETKVEEVVVDETKVEEVEDFDNMSYSDLKELIIDRKIVIEGKISKSKMINELKNNLKHD